MERSNLFILGLSNTHIIKGHCQSVQIAAPPPMIREGFYSDIGKCCLILTAFYLSRRGLAKTAPWRGLYAAKKKRSYIMKHVRRRQHFP